MTYIEWQYFVLVISSLFFLRTQYRRFLSKGLSLASSYLRVAFQLSLQVLLSVRAFDLRHQTSRPLWCGILRVGQLWESKQEICMCLFVVMYRLVVLLIRRFTIWRCSSAQIY